MVFLVSKSRDSSSWGIRSIAAEIGANEHTTGKILQLLSREGFILSVKGPSGGFYFQQKSKPVYLIDIVRVVDGDHFFKECGLGLKACSETKPCPIHYQYKEVRENLYANFCQISLQQLSGDLELGKSFLKR